MKQTLLCVFCFSFLLFANCLFARQPQETYEKLFSSDLKDSEIIEMFDNSFIKKIPVSEIKRIIKIYSDSLGELSDIDSSEKPFKLMFAKGNALSTIAFSKEGKIISLWFGAPELENDSFEKVLADVMKLDGQISLCIMKNGSDVLFEQKSDMPLAIGSSFKLFILEALEKQFNEGIRKPEDVVKIRNDWKSLPSGILQEWPEGVSITLETLACLMISVSDNTATDYLFNLLGRKELGKIFPETCQPPINTGEMFKMKLVKPEAGKEFIAANKAKRLKVLKELESIELDESTLKSIGMNWNKPKMIELEWYVTTRQLCETIYGLRHSRALLINPAQGICSKKDWNMIGFKGGSEPGVLNYTWVLQTKNSDDYYCFSATINNKKEEVNTSEFSAAVSRFLKLIEKM